MSSEDSTKETRSAPPKKGARNVVHDIGANYLRGLVALGLSYGLWRAIQEMSSRAEQVGVQTTMLLLLGLIFIPPALGWLIGRVLYPRMRHVRMLRTVLQGEERFAAQLAPDSRRGFPVALVNWPNESVRSICVITTTHRDSESSREFATVFLPGCPDVRRGMLRVAPLDELETIDWSLTECLQSHVTFGTHSPGFLHKPDKLRPDGDL